MGSMFSSPEMPSYPYYTPYTPTSTPSAPSSNDGGSDAPTADGGGDADRVAAIARRRSFPDTIQTSWRGVLQQGPWAPQRKSLLGE